VHSGKISGDGIFTHKCHEYFTQRYGFGKCLLTTSCTDALEMAAILLDIKEGDEVIMPSYTFVSTANAFVLRGARIIFADSGDMNPNLDAGLLESLISSRTKAIVVVHYAGIACDMDAITDIAKKYNLFVVEDAAQAIDSFYKGKPLGSIGHLAAFSFHETKNVIAGEGGMLVINDVSFRNRSEIIREKGTNRSSFFRGEVDKYGWVDIGSSFLPSDIIAAFLYAQLENLEIIQAKRKGIWDRYQLGLKPLAEKGIAQLPYVPEFATNNAHMFYLVFRDLQIRQQVIAHLKQKGIMAVFHYQSLHQSEYYLPKHDGRELPNSDRFTDNLLRLPLYYDLQDNDVDEIIIEILAALG
jgi:dTDP-4-amino-4,6-dideoxygalactose transaminase